MATASPGTRHGAPQRIALRGVNWADYQAVREALDDRSVRMTYDRGVLELMTPLPIHERYKVLIGRMIDMMTLEMRMRVVGLGSATFQREDLERGLEPDQCYYFSSAEKVADWARIDLSVDPPPDLAIEIDIASDSRRRLSIYAALGVPEVWRFDGERLDALRLGERGEYQPVSNSEYFPLLPMEEVARFLRQYALGDDTAWAAAFQDWFRETVLPPLEKG